MTTLTLKINERTKAGKAFIAMSETFLSGVDGIEIVENKKSTAKTVYSTEFVEMILKSSKSKNRTKVNSKNLWQSI